MLKNKIIASVAAVLAVTSVSGFSFSIAANAAMTQCHRADPQSKYYGGTTVYRGYATANGSSCYILSGRMYTTYGSTEAYGTATQMQTNWLSSTYTSGHGEFSFRHYGQILSEQF